MPNVTLTAGCFAALLTVGGTALIAPALPLALAAEAPAEALAAELKHLAVARLAAELPCEIELAWLGVDPVPLPLETLAARQHRAAQAFARDHAVLPAIWTAPNPPVRTLEF